MKFFENYKLYLDRDTNEITINVLCNVCRKEILATDSYDFCCKVSMGGVPYYHEAKFWCSEECAKIGGR